MPSRRKKKRERRIELIRRIDLLRNTFFFNSECSSESGVIFGNSRNRGNMRARGIRAPLNVVVKQLLIQAYHSVAFG